MRILILGGNGFIGFEVSRTALNRGHSVVCIGRDIASASRKLTSAKWHAVDIASLDDPSKWKKYTEGADAIVNCSGALQSSPRDNLEAVQFTALRALYEAAQIQGELPIVQISANTMTALTGGTTEFLETKSRADEQLKLSGLPHVILRPTLVVGRNCYGGTALLRAVASLPFEAKTSFADQSCQTTDLEELAQITIDAVEGKQGINGDFTVASPEVTTIGKIQSQMRAWLGISGGWRISVPGFAISLTAIGADIAGYFGWRSPMRSTAITILSEGVTADETKKIIETSSLKETLTRHPSGAQDIWYGRSYFLKPVAIIVLSAFWLLTGLIALIKIYDAASYFTAFGTGLVANLWFVIVTALLDCVLGIAILFRRFTRWAALGMIALSLWYLAIATLVTPRLWIDPIGPLVKVVPSILLTVFLLAVLEER